MESAGKVGNVLELESRVGLLGVCMCFVGDGESFPSSVLPACACGALTMVPGPGKGIKGGN